MIFTHYIASKCYYIFIRTLTTVESNKLAQQISRQLLSHQPIHSTITNNNNNNYMLCKVALLYTKKKHTLASNTTQPPIMQDAAH